MTTLQQALRATEAGARARQRGAQRRALGTSSKTFQAARDDARTPSRKRTYRMQLRDGIKSFSKHSGLRGCGAKVIDKAGVTVKAGGTAGAGFSGLATCGSVWVCPSCAAKVASSRAADLEHVLETAVQRGHTVALFTFTVRHKSSDSLRDVWGAVQSGWHGITGGARWKSIMREHGVIGWAKAVEVTHGANGWHVHIHAVVVLDGCGISLGHEMWARWERGIDRAGFKAIKDRGGFDVQIGRDAVTAIGSYLVKQQQAGEPLVKQTAGDIAREAIHGQQKSGRLGGMAPFDLARAILDLELLQGDTPERRRLVAIWREWEAGSKGRQQIAWSKDLREWAGLHAEKSDEEIAAEEADGDDLITIPAAGWRRVMRERGLNAWILEEAERNGFAGVRDLLDHFEIPWFHPDNRDYARDLA